MNEIKVTRVDGIDVRHDETGAQMIAVPAGFELPEGKVSIRKEGDRLIIEVSEANKPEPKTWADFFDQMETIDVEWPDVDEGLLPLDDINL